MEMTYSFENQPNGDCVIWVCEGSHGVAAVMRTTDGVYTCQSRQCIWKGTRNNCEHVQFAAVKYDSDIKPNEQWKLEQEKQRNLTRLKVLQEQIAALDAKNKPEEEKTALDTFDLQRRIVVEE